MEFSAEQIAGLLDGTVDGNPQVTVSKLAKIEEGVPGSLTFLANPKYTPHIYNTGSSIAIVANTFEPEESLPENLTLIKVQDPYACFAKLLEHYNTNRHQKTGISKSAAISEQASIGKDVYIGEGVVVEAGAHVGDGCKIYGQVYIGEQVHIGNHTVIYPGVKVMNDSSVGAHCTLHPGVIIGGDGFGFAPNSENEYHKVAQIGNVIIEDHVEIGSNTTIDRATLGSTIIRKGAKIDNLIQIAHNVEIGENTVIAAQTGIAGSTKIGKNCMIGGQVGIIGHVHIADEVKIAAQSGISSSINVPGTIVQGSPAMEIKKFKMAYIGFRKLPKIQEKLDQLANQIKGISAE